MKIETIDTGLRVSFCGIRFLWDSFPLNFFPIILFIVNRYQGYLKSNQTALDSNSSPCVIDPYTSSLLYGTISPEVTTTIVRERIRSFFEKMQHFSFFRYFNFLLLGRQRRRPLLRMQLDLLKISVGQAYPLVTTMLLLDLAMPSSLLPNVLAAWLTCPSGLWCNLAIDASAVPLSLCHPSLIQSMTLLMSRSSVTRWNKRMSSRRQ